MDIEIGIAGNEDIVGMTGLLEQLFSLEPQFQPDGEVQSRGLRAIVDDPGIGEILVARAGGIPVGMACLLYTVSTARGGKVALLEDVIVSREYRSRGIGKRLLEGAIEHARTTGCLRISLLTDEHNTDAQRLYARLGFSTYGMTPMRLHL